MGKIANRYKGAVGENMAVDYLRSNGYEILERNFTAVEGEIDIIALHDHVLVFVEVKESADDKFGTPAERVTKAKQRKISQVASRYIRKYRYYEIDVRFDVIEVYGNSGKINHIQDAFDSFLRY